MELDVGLSLDAPRCGSLWRANGSLGRLFDVELADPPPPSPLAVYFCTNLVGTLVCPATRPSKRKAPRWGTVARLPAGEVREALAAELATERSRDVPVGRTGGMSAAEPSGVADAVPSGRTPAGIGAASAARTTP